MSAAHIEAIEIPSSVARDAAAEPDAVNVKGNAASARDARLALLGQADKLAETAGVGHKRADRQFCDLYNTDQLQIAGWIKGRSRPSDPAHAGTLARLCQSRQALEAGGRSRRRAPRHRRARSRQRRPGQNPHPGAGRQTTAAHRAPHPQAGCRQLPATHGRRAPRKTAADQDLSTGLEDVARNLPRRDHVDPQPRFVQGARCGLPPASPIRRHASTRSGRSTPRRPTC